MALALLVACPSAPCGHSRGNAGKQGDKASIMRIFVRSFYLKNIQYRGVTDYFAKIQLFLEMCKYFGRFFHLESALFAVVYQAKITGKTFRFSTRRAGILGKWRADFRTRASR